MRKKEEEDKALEKADMRKKELRTIEILQKIMEKRKREKRKQKNPDIIIYNIIYKKIKG